MGKFSFSSQKRKPLFFLSLVGCLTFFSICFAASTEKRTPITSPTLSINHTPKQTQKLKLPQKLQTSINFKDFLIDNLQPKSSEQKPQKDQELESPRRENLQKQTFISDIFSYFLEKTPILLDLAIQIESLGISQNCRPNFEIIKAAPIQWSAKKDRFLNLFFRPFEYPPLSIEQLKTFSQISRKKNHQSAHSFGENYFSASDLVEIKKVALYSPVQENRPKQIQKLNLFSHIKKGSKLSLSPLLSSLPFIYEKTFPFILLTKDSDFFCGKTAVLASYRALYQWNPSPYLFTTSKEIPQKIEKNYYPKKERAIPLSPRYTLAKDSTFALKLEKEVYLFSLVPNFELFCLGKKNLFPKKNQEFQQSILSFLHPHLIIPKFWEENEKIKNPNLEKHSISLCQKALPLEISIPSTKKHSLHLVEDKDYLLLVPMTTPPKHRCLYVSNNLDIALKMLATQKNESSLALNFHLPLLEKQKKTIKYPPNSIPKQIESLVFSQSWDSRFDSIEEVPIQTASGNYFKNKSPSKLQQKKILRTHNPHKLNKFLEDIPKLDSMTTTLSHIERNALPMYENSSALENFYSPCTPGVAPWDFAAVNLKIESPINPPQNKYFKTITPLSDLEKLSYLKTRQILLAKTLMTPQKGIHSLSTPESELELAQRESHHLNAYDLIEHSPLPMSPPPFFSIVSDKIQGIQTNMIHSQANGMIKDYDEENRYSVETIQLAKPELEEKPNNKELRVINESTRFTQRFLAEIPPPSNLNTVTYDNEFQPEIHYSLKEDGKGYFFSIKMNPKTEFNFASPEQNFIFVIDGSSSIQKHRFGVFKEGVGNAIQYMKTGDTFNILIADAELISLAKTPSEWNKENINKARHFLQNNNYRGFFINYNAFSLLSQATKYFDPNRENIVILLTDGHSFKSFQEHRDNFLKLTAAAKNHFSIYTATAAQNNNLLMLDLLSTFNSGELMYSKTNAAFPRQLSRLVKHIEHFVAKDIHVEIISPKQNTGIECYPNQNSLPPFYSDKAYTIYGSIDELKDFDLILQGRCGDGWINIKQHITFKHAEKASQSIKRSFALQQAYVCYSYFLQNSNPFFLNEAERILGPHDIPTAVR